MSSESSTIQHIRRISDTEASTVENLLVTELPFELRAFEGVLSQVCGVYQERTLLLSPLVRNVMNSLSAKQINTEILHQLLPMKDALAQVC